MLTVWHGTQKLRPCFSMKSSSREKHTVTMNKLAMTTAAFALFPLAACGPTEEQTQPDQTAVEAPDGPGVIREETQAAEMDLPVPRMAPQAVIQSQPGPDGTQFDLLKVAVTGDILTVTMQCSTDGPFRNPSIDVRKVSLIDDSTSQRISVLKDNADNWLASDVSGNFMRTACREKPGVVWAKFPAPPPTSQTVSIALPQVAPFDGVNVTR